MTVMHPGLSEARKSASMRSVIGALSTRGSCRGAPCAGRYVCTGTYFAWVTCIGGEA